MTNSRPTQPTGLPERFVAIDAGANGDYACYAEFRRGPDGKLQVVRCLHSVPAGAAAGDNQRDTAPALPCDVEPPDTTG